ncbi:MAG: ComF family protein [Clostridia bacterium]|nr:ComF family protein [Clostridia bacterium]
MRKDKAFTLLKNLLFPPRCVGCGRRMPPLCKGDALCGDCRLQWEAELRHTCPDCFALCGECTCLPPLLKRAKATALVRCAYYGEGEENRVARHVVLSVKRHPDRAALRFAAREMLEGVQAAVLREWYSLDRVVLTHLPRAARNRRRYGLDQAQELACELAAYSGMAYRPLLLRQKEGKQQKTLHAAERERNLRDAFALATGEMPECVVLVDDIVTTGAGTAAATRLLHRAGCRCVIVASFAYTLRKKSRIH